MRVRLLRRAWTLVIVSIILVCGLLGASLLIVQRLASKKGAPAPISQPKNVIHYSTNTPAEKPPTTQTYHSTATGNEPQYIKLPSIGAEGYIEAVGLDQYGAVAVPSNVHLAGWYVNTLTPGQDGLSVIDGHVNGRTSPGIFAGLAKLAVGDTLEVALANGVVEHFAVKSTSQVPVQAANTALFSRDNTIASQLNLVTCGGTFNRDKGAYEDRIIVVAALVQ